MHGRVDNCYGVISVRLMKCLEEAWGVYPIVYAAEGYILKME
jgi:hypothetical protein